ncbi:hypothetical protein AMK16_26485 [Streptomyces sp. CB00455]|nr:hypothetical protein [Streptomyces sp. CB00455]OKK16231.1 hypothetical protein AMK16_26485 [Streptomyces sp. CB00455]
MGELQLIDAVLGEMSGIEHAERWSREALATDVGWRQVRTLARDLLVSLQGVRFSALENLAAHLVDDEEPRPQAGAELVGQAADCLGGFELRTMSSRLVK